MTARDYVGLAIAIGLAIYTGIGSVLRILEYRRDEL